MWQCGVCGLIWEAEEAPDACPNCGTAKAKFSAVKDKAADQIDKARFSNSLLMQLYVITEQMMDVAEDGIDDNLDPTCARIFQRAFDEAEGLQQSIKAEIQGHIGKGKWG